MSNYTFEKKISIGNIIQICILSVAIIGGYFGMISSVNANTIAHEKNSEQIVKIQSEMSSLDVLEYKVDSNKIILERIELKLDE